MSRKDYVLIAESFAFATSRLQNAFINKSGLNQATHKELAQLNALETVANNLARKLSADNPRFRRDTFMKACGL